MKYNVNAVETVVYETTVEAESKEEAIEKSKTFEAKYNVVIGSGFQNHTAKKVV